MLLGPDEDAPCWYLCLHLASAELAGPKLGFPIPGRWSNVLCIPPPQTPEAHSPMGVPVGRVNSTAAFAFGRFSTFPSVFPPTLLCVLLLKLEGAAWAAPRCLCI